MKIEEIINKPIFFERNRVNRVYVGGESFKELFGNDEPGDNYFPEEWIASTVKAINKTMLTEKDGVSKVLGTDIYFDDLVKEYKKELFGDKEFDILIKYLDSAIRLPMQVHPTKEFSKKHFNSNFGKTESWLVINTRPGAKMYFGFNKKYTKEYLMELETKSENEKDIWESVALEKEVKVGDTFIINAGLIHAIGYGCTVIEVQEPTDFTIQPEKWCGEYHLNSKEEFLGLDKNAAFDAFNLDLVGDEAIKYAKVEPEVIYNQNGIKKESLITYEHTKCFKTNKYTINKSELILNEEPSVYIILDGNGEIIGEKYNKKIKKGDYFFMPVSAFNNYKISSNNEIILVECLPSEQ